MRESIPQASSPTTSLLHIPRFLRLCLRFTVLSFISLSFISAFPRGHYDVLNGTWLRCVQATKAWIVATGLTTKDLVECVNTADPPTWCPHGKTRIIILVYAPLTLKDYLSCPSKGILFNL